MAATKSGSKSAKSAIAKAPVKAGRKAVVKAPWRSAEMLALAKAKASETLKALSGVAEKAIGMLADVKKIGEAKEGIEAAHARVMFALHGVLLEKKGKALGWTFTMADGEKRIAEKRQEVVAALLGKGTADPATKAYGEVMRRIATRYSAAHKMALPTTRRQVVTEREEREGFGIYLRVRDAKAASGFTNLKLADGKVKGVPAHAYFSEGGDAKSNKENPEVFNSLAVALGDDAQAFHSFLSGFLNRKLDATKGKNKAA